MGEEGRDQVEDEEGQPAGDEAPDYDRQRLGRFVLALQGHDAIGH